MLPPGKKFKIEPVLDLINKKNCRVEIAIELCCGCDVIQSERMMCGADKYHVSVSRLLLWDTPTCRKECFLTVRLLSPQNVEIVNGKLFIMET